MPQKDEEVYQVVTVLKHIMSVAHYLNVIGRVI